MIRRGFLLLLFWGLTCSGAPPAVDAVDSIGITVSDLERSVDFYCRVLSFEKVSEYEADGDAYEHLHGLFGLRMRTARLKLGQESIELTEFLAPKGRPMPPGSRSNDRWFQHIAIVVSDMEKAYLRLREHRVQHASSGPQRLPDWNRNAGGIQAFYFEDPDGHVLEILSFPADKGDARWHEASGRLFLGIDHTAIVISDTQASLSHYRDLLGLRVAGESENFGPEQERLNNVFGARLRITTLRAASGPGVEFLEYLAPSGGRPYPADARSNDLVHWVTKFASSRVQEAARDLSKSRTAFVSSGVVVMPDEKAGFRKSLIARDPDGHAFQIFER